MHEYLCLISAISPHGGPGQGLLDLDSVNAIAHEMALEVTASGAVKVNPVQLEETLQEALLSTEPEGLWPDWYPKGFRDDSDPYFQVCKLFQRSDDGSVRVSRVVGYEQERYSWQRVIRKVTNGEWELENCWLEAGTEDGDPFFCWERPYQYLRNWVSSGTTPNFDELFFELVNSHRGPACEY